MLRFSKVVSALLFVAVGASACSQSPKTQFAGQATLESPSDNPVRAEFHSYVVEPLARALEKSDEDLLPPLSPSISKEDRQQITDAVARTAEFGVEEVSLTLGGSRKLERQSQNLRLKGSYRLEGVGADLVYTASIGVEPTDDGQWHLRRFTWRLAPPWVGAQSVSRTETGAAVIFHTADLQAQELGRLVAEARATLGRSLPGVRSERYLVFAGPKDDFRQAGGRGEASVVSEQTFDGRDFSHSEPWLLVNTTSWDKSEPDARRSLILHEVTHAILAPFTSPFVPTWVVEGLAVHYSGDPGLQVFDAEPELLDRTSLREVAAGTSLSEFFAKHTAANYAVSGAAISYLVERFGEQQVLEFLQAYGTEVTDEEIDRVQNPPLRVPGALTLSIRNLSNDVTERLLPKLFDLDIDELNAEAARWIRQH